MKQTSINNACQSCVDVLLPRRLAPRSVEKLFTEAAAACTKTSAGALQALVLHVRFGEAAVLPYCHDQSDDGGGALMSDHFAENGVAGGSASSTKSQLLIGSRQPTANLSEGASLRKSTVVSDLDVGDAARHQVGMGAKKVNTHIDVETQEEAAKEASVEIRVVAVEALARERDSHTIGEHRIVDSEHPRDVELAKTKAMTHTTGVHDTILFLQLQRLTSCEQFTTLAVLSGLVVLTLASHILQLWGILILKPLVSNAFLIALAASTLFSVIAALCRGGFSTACALEKGVYAVVAVTGWFLSASWRLLSAAAAAFGISLPLQVLLWSAAWLFACLVLRMRTLPPSRENAGTATQIRMLKELCRIQGGMLCQELCAGRAAERAADMAQNANAAERLAATKEAMMVQAVEVEDNYCRREGSRTVSSS